MLFVNVQNNFIQDVHSYSVEHNLQDLSWMCDQTLKNIKHIIQLPRQLNVML